MSKAFISVEGFIAEPRRGQTNSGEPVLNISVGFTPSRFDKQLNQWVDTGDTLWANAALYEEAAEAFGPQLNKGDYVRVEGRPELRSYVDKSGEPRVELVIKSPKVMKVLRVPARNDVQAGENQFGQWSNAPAASGRGDDASGAQNATGNNSPWGSSPAAENSMKNERPF